MANDSMVVDLGGGLKHRVTSSDVINMLDELIKLNWWAVDKTTDFANKDECFLSVDDTAELVKRAEELEIENRAMADKVKCFEEEAVGLRQRVERLDAHSEASKAVIAAQKQEIKTLEAAVTKRSNTIITQACKMRDLYQELEALRSANADLHKAAQSDPNAITLLPHVYTPGELFPGVGGPLSAGPVVQRYEFGGFSPAIPEQGGTGAKPMQSVDGAVVRVIARVLLRIINKRNLREYVNQDDINTLIEHYGAGLEDV